MKTMVIYHGGTCADGFCSAWLFHRVFPDAEFVPANYGDPPPDVTNRYVFIVDFSYKRPALIELIQACRGNVTVLDHHPTAEAELAGLAQEMRTVVPREPQIIFDMSKSGGRLAWEYLRQEHFSKTESAPWLVDYTEDRDLWRHRLEKSREINAALKTYPFEFETWDRLAAQGATMMLRGLPQFVIEGEAVLRMEQRIIDTHVRNAKEVEIGGHMVLAVNATTLISEIAGELAKDRPFGATYYDRGDKRVWSLRVRDGDFDVGKLAASKGGGGHVRAAGFEEVLLR